MSNEKKKRVVSAALAEEIRGDVEGDGFIRREHLGPADLFFLEYEYPALWTDWTSASLRSPAEIRAAKRLLAALDKCAAGTPDAPTTITPAWATRLLELATAQHDAAVVCKAAEERYDAQYAVYERVRVARNEARDLVRQRSRELREATTALALLKASS